MINVWTLLFSPTSDRPIWCVIVVSPVHVESRPESFLRENPWRFARMLLRPWGGCRGLSSKENLNGDSSGRPDLRLTLGKVGRVDVETVSGC